MSKLYYTDNKHGTSSIESLDARLVGLRDLEYGESMGRVYEYMVRII